mgnify:CR=1 FL=1
MLWKTSASVNKMKVQTVGYIERELEIYLIMLFLIHADVFCVKGIKASGLHNIRSNQIQLDRYIVR